MKKLIILALTGAILLSAQAIGFAGINIEVNGKNVPFDANNGLGVPFVDENNRTLVPFRIAMEFAGATVDWDNDTRTAIAMKDGIKVEAPIGKNYIYKDGVKETIDTQAVIKDGRTYLPIRAVLEALEYEISWEQETQTVVAETEEYIAETVVEEEIVVPGTTSPAGEIVLGETKPVSEIITNLHDLDKFNDELETVTLVSNDVMKMELRTNTVGEKYIEIPHTGGGVITAIKNGKTLSSFSGIPLMSKGITAYMESRFNGAIESFDYFGFYEPSGAEVKIVANPWKE